MSHWKNPTIHLGVIKAGSPKKVTFKGLEEIPEIKAIIPHCGCTTTNFDKVNKELTITYSNSQIPNQVQGPQAIKKRIDITYEDESTEILTITATRIR
jgi:hypothetical protein